MQRNSFKFQHSHSSINKVENLARALDIDLGLLQKNSEDYSNRYRQKDIMKKSGGIRTLNIPNDELKGIQKRVNQRILSHVFFPHYVFGGIKSTDRGTDYIDVSHYHAGAWIKCELDIDSFFPSVSQDHVLDIFNSFFKFSIEVSELLVGLCTENDELPQGSPTSVALANLIFFEKEPNLAYNLYRNGFRYSRFIDDIVVTHPHRSASIDPARKKVERMISSYNLACNSEKTIRRETAFNGLKVFGFLVSSEEARITARDVRMIRGMIQRLESEARIANARKSDRFKRSWDKISGQLNKLKRLDHPKYKAYRLRMRKILPLLSDSNIKSVVTAVETLETSATDIRNPAAYRRFFYRTRSRIGILARTHPVKADMLRARMRLIQNRTVL